MIFPPNFIRLKNVKLHFKKYGDGGPPLVILHGFLGSLDNWHTVAKNLASDCTVYTLDQRNHGHSPHSEVFTYQALAEDLIEFLNEESLETAILLGHSMGGKTAMFAATAHPERVKKLIVADMGIKRYPPDHQAILDALQKLPVKSLATRQEADERLAEQIPDWRVRQWLLKNLVRRPGGGFAWRVNLPVLVENYPNILVALPENARFDGPTLFIRGENSPYIHSEDWPEIRKHFPKMKSHTIANAGHWLHAEAPEEFVRVVREFIFSLE